MWKGNIGIFTAKLIKNKKKKTFWKLSDKKQDLIEKKDTSPTTICKIRMPKNIKIEPKNVNKNK
jgi:hypothetical protein